MGTMTLADLQIEIAGPLGKTALLNAGADSSLSRRWCNFAMQEFGYALKFRELIGTDNTLVSVAGTETIDLPTDFRYIHDDGILVTSPESRIGKLIPETRNNFLLHRGYIQASARGQPSHYHVYPTASKPSGALFLRPVPDSTVITLLVHYWKKITAFSTSGTTSPFPDDWDDVILAGAIYRGFRYYGEFDRYQNVRNDYLALLKSRVNDSQMEEFPIGGLSYTQDESENVQR